MVSIRTNVQPADLEDRVMPWWGWIIIGAVLFGSELMLVDAAFYLVFIGIAAVITGLLVLTGVVIVPWVQWLIFAVLALASMFLFRERLYKKLRVGKEDYASGPAGEFLRLEETLQPGETCRMTYRGTTWTVLNNGADAMHKGANVLIESVNGLTLVVVDSDKDRSS